MKILPYITLLFLFSCSPKPEPGKEILCWYKSDIRLCERGLDTMKLSELQPYVAEKGDTLLGERKFEFEGREHILSVHSNIGRAKFSHSTDGGGEFYVLDDLGMIYQRRFWCYCSLKTNSDSLNKLLAEAYDRILFYKDLKDAQFPLPETIETIH